MTTDALLEAPIDEGDNVGIDDNEQNLAGDGDESNTPPEPQDDEESQNQEEEKDVADSGEVIFPKKAINAISRRDKKISKMEYELNQLRNQLTNSQSQNQQSAGGEENDTPPNEDNFETWADYNNAVIQHQIKQAMKSQQGVTNTGQQGENGKPQTPEQIQEQVWVQHRSQEVEQQTAELAKTIPDLADVVQANADLLENISPEFERTFLSLENPAMAFYNLAKNGRLESVLGMPIHLAAIEMVNAQKGSSSSRNSQPQQQQSKRVSSAPRPIQGANGSGSVNKNPADMSADEVAEYFGI